MADLLPKSVGSLAEKFAGQGFKAGLYARDGVGETSIRSIIHGQFGASSAAMARTDGSLLAWQDDGRYEYVAFFNKRQRDEAIRYAGGWRPGRHLMTVDL